MEPRTGMNQSFSTLR